MSIECLFFLLLICTTLSQPSENPTYKLSYFNLKGRAEPIRMLFAYGGIEYEDFRLAKEEWPEFKPTMPLGQVPVLEVDGQQVHQSIAIARYVAKKVGLAGQNDWESLLIDVVVDTISDFSNKIAAAHYETDEDVKAKKIETVKKEVIPFYSEKLDAIAKENNGYLANNKLTWADFVFVAFVDYFKFITGNELTEDRPNLKKVVENVNNLPKIKSWFGKRPHTEL